MRAGAWLGVLLAACVTACGSAPPPAPASPSSASEPAAPAPKEHAAEDVVEPQAQEAHEHGDPGPSTSSPSGAANTPPRAPSTASFEQATSVPEPILPNDDRLQLTDNQLNEPMRGVLTTCRVPPSARVTIKTAVQYGRAIGVTVVVELPKPKPPKKGAKRVSKEAAKAAAKTIARVTSCADHAVRALTWPPSRRRDAFTTTF